MSGMAFDQLADIIVGLPDKGGQLLECAGSVVILNIFQCGKDQVLFILRRIVFVDFITLVLEQDKQKPHGGLVDIPGVFLFCYERIDQVFH